MQALPAPAPAPKCQDNTGFVQISLLEWKGGREEVLTLLFPASVVQLGSTEGMGVGHPQHGWGCDPTATPPQKVTYSPLLQ